MCQNYSEFWTRPRRNRKGLRSALCGAQILDPHDQPGHQPVYLIFHIDPPLGWSFKQQRLAKCEIHHKGK